MTTFVGIVLSFPRRLHCFCLIWALRLPWRFLGQRGLDTMEIHHKVSFMDWRRVLCFHRLSLLFPRGFLVSRAIKYSKYYWRIDTVYGATTQCDILIAVSILSRFMYVLFLLELYARHDTFYILVLTCSYWRNELCISTSTWRKKQKNRFSLELNQLID